MAKKDGAAKITLIDHTAGERHSCSVLEGVTHLARLVEKGSGEHSIHIVDLAAEKERKLTNPKKSTKRYFNCRTPEQLVDFNKAVEPFFEVAVDPHIAIDLITRALAGVDRETIRGWIQEGQDDREGPPPAEPLPGDEWFAGRPRDDRDDNDKRFDFQRENPREVDDLPDCLRDDQEE